MSADIRGNKPKLVTKNVKTNKKAYEKGKFKSIDKYIKDKGKK